MAKQIGKCVHCLKDGIKITADHMLPKSWYPDATPDDLERWTVPSCEECNRFLGKVEDELKGRLALALDAKNPANARLGEKALRKVDPKAGRDERDAAAREAGAKKLASALRRGEQITQSQTIPGLEERWARPIEQQVAVEIPGDKLETMTKKIVRGLAFRADDAFIDDSYTIECQLAQGQGLKEFEEQLDKFGDVYRREPALTIRRLVDPQDKKAGLYEITFWNQFKTYATVSKKSAAPAASS